MPETWTATGRTVVDGRLWYAWQPQGGQATLFLQISNGTTQPLVSAVMGQFVADRYTTPYGGVPKKLMDIGPDAQYQSIPYVANGVSMQAEVIAQRTGPYLIIIGMEGPEDQLLTAKNEVSTILTSVRLDPTVKAPEIGIR